MPRWKKKKTQLCPSTDSASCAPPPRSCQQDQTSRDGGGGIQARATQLWRKLRKCCLSSASVKTWQKSPSMKVKVALQEETCNRWTPFCKWCLFWHRLCSLFSARWMNWWIRPQILWWVIVMVVTWEKCEFDMMGRYDIYIITKVSKWIDKTF